MSRMYIAFTISGSTRGVRLIIVSLQRSMGLVLVGKHCYGSWMSFIRHPYFMAMDNISVSGGPLIHCVL